MQYTNSLLLYIINYSFSQTLEKNRTQFLVIKR